MYVLRGCVQLLVDDALVQVNKAKQQISFVVSQWILPFLYFQEMKVWLLPYLDSRQRIGVRLIYCP
jgi:hypothetical protein